MEQGHQLALRLVADPNLVAAPAHAWLKAYDRDPTVPEFAAPPYWQPAGQHGVSWPLEEALAFSGVDRRLQLVQEVDDDDDWILGLASDDPDPRVRDAARGRLI